MTTQDLFNIASRNYLEAHKLVSDLGVALAAAVPDFDVRGAYCGMDIIIQYVLLETALADGKFTEIEGEFIDKITDYFDVIHLFDNIPDGMNWKWFATHAPFSDISNIIGELKNLAEVHMTKFAELFAMLDAAVKDLDVLGEMVKHIAQIATCFALVDGNGEEIESKTAADVTNRYLILPWLEMRNKMINS